MKRYATVLLSAVVCIAGLSACAPQGKDIDNTTMGDDPSGGFKDVQLTTFSLFAGEGGDAGMYTALLDEFKAEYPGVEITDHSQPYSEKAENDLVTAFESGSQPDVFFFHTGENAAAFAKGSLVVPVEEVKAKYPDYARDILPWALENTVEGPYGDFAVPVRGFYEGLFVNTDLFEKYELELPTDWNRFIKAVDTFAEAGIVPVSAALKDTPHYLLDHLLLSSGGAEDYEKSPKTSGEIPQSWTSAFESLTALYERTAFGQQTAELTEGDATELFLQKKAAMQLDGSWFAARLEANGMGDTTMVLPFPTAQGGKMEQGEIVGGFTSGYYLSRKAWDDPKKQQAAVALIEKLTTADAVNRFDTLSGLPAAKINTEPSGSALTKSAYALCAAVKTAVLPLDARMNTDAWSYITANTLAVASGEAEAQQVFEQAFPK